MSTWKLLVGLGMGLGGGAGVGCWLEKRRATRGGAQTPTANLALPPQPALEARLAQAGNDFLQAEARVEQQVRTENWTQAAMDLVSMAKALARVQDRHLAARGAPAPELGDLRNRLDKRMRQVGTRSLAPPNVYGITEGGEP
jgi:hypothetical protein